MQQDDVLTQLSVDLEIVRQRLDAKTLRHLEELRELGEVLQAIRSRISALRDMTSSRK